jgi:hypothetical protein
MTAANAKSWWASRTIWGAIISAAALAASYIGIPVSDAQQAELVEIAVPLAGGIGTLLTIVGRLWASRPVKGGGGSTALALLLIAALAAGGPVACASLAGETPAQRVYGIQADYVAAQHLAAATLADDRVPPAVAHTIKRLDAAAWSAVGEARRAVVAGDDPAVAAALAAARHAGTALASYLAERGASS